MPPTISSEYWERLRTVEVEVKALKDMAQENAVTQKRANTFFDKHDADRESELRHQNALHQQNQDKADDLGRRINRYGLIVAIFGLICTICMVIIAVRRENSPSPQKTSQVNPSQQHSDLPASYQP